jgi:hypothetical protein
MCLLPFVVITLRATLFQKTDVSRAKEFYKDTEKPRENILICLGGQCPSLDARTIKVTGTKHEMHSALLSILLQLNTSSTKIVISAPKHLHAFLKHTLNNMEFDYLIIY